MPGRTRFNVDAMRRDQARAYGRVRASREKVKSLERMLHAAHKELHSSIGAAADKDIPQSAIAELTGYTEARIWQIVNDWHPAKKGKTKR